MVSSSKAAEEYWLSKIDYPFSSGDLAWGTRQRSGAEKRVIYEEELSTQTSSNINALANNDAALQLLWLAALKIVLCKYLDEVNININCFNETGFLPSMLSVTQNTSLDNFIKTLKRDFNESMHAGEADFSNVLEVYNIRTGRDIKREFYKFALAFGGGVNDSELLRHDLICRVHRGDNGLRVSVAYFSEQAFATEFLQLFLHNWINLVVRIRELRDWTIAKIQIQSDRDASALDAGASLDHIGTNTPASSIHKLFELAVSKHSTDIAIKCGDKSISYNELNTRSDQLAGFLIKQGVSTNTIVGLMFNRSIEMVVAILGVLKSGGTFMPIDLNYPQDRKRYMLQDSMAGVLLTDVESVSFDHVRVFRYQDIEFNSGDIPANVDDPDSFAYVLYTSGTTGRPKGVCITHQNLTDLFLKQKFFKFGGPCTWSFCHSYCFDFSVWEMFGALLFGGKLIIYSDATVRDPEKFVKEVIDENVSILCQTPKALYGFIDYVLVKNIRSLSVQLIFVGGEPLNYSKLKMWMERFPGISLINMYGITETTITSTYKNILPVDISSQANNIGVAFPHAKIKILNNDFAEVPIGSVGEIFIGGVSVGKGYLNRVELTAERFKQIQANDAEIYYRSGDLARRFPNGEIEYLGRKDNQIKVHGFRIELEEIEAQLLGSGLFKDVVATVSEFNGNRDLCVYYESEKNYDVTLLKEKLKEIFPHYMIPNYLMRLDKIPITVNGKKDKARLPEMVVTGGIKRFEPPQTFKEKLLAKVWRNLFGQHSINIHDEFYEAGGDSIKAIQLKAGLMNCGFTIEMSDILKQNTFYSIAAGIREIKEHVDQGQVEGKVRLHPIQIKFLQDNRNARNHFNQSLLLRIDGHLSLENLQLIFKKIFEHHDALRLRMKDSSGFIEKEVPVSITHLTLQDTEDVESIFQEVVKIQKSINLAAVPLMKLGLFDVTGKNETLLLIAAHHFVIDGISWRILLDDVTTLYHQARNNASLQLPLKTDSIKTWNELLHAAVDSRKIVSELPYWESICSHSAPLFGKIDSSMAYAHNFASRSFTLEGSEGISLLTKANEAYHTKTEELLLSALYLALHAKFGIDETLITLEQHGRNIKLNGDISRTIGWFTSIFPFYISFRKGDTIPTIIKNIKERIRRIPSGGLGYGVLKFCAPNGEYQTRLKYTADVEFNYLGQFNDVIINKPFEVVRYAPGETHDESFRFDAPLVINCFIDELNSLHLNFIHNVAILPAVEADHLAGLFKHFLVKVIECCVSNESREHTPADFFYDISTEKFEELSERYRIEDVFPLTPVQEGILFHHLFSRGQNVYFEQVCYVYNKSINVNVLFESLDILSQRHQMLRSVYTYEELERPLQLILTDQRIGRRFEDVSNLPLNEQLRVATQLKDLDREEGFNVAEGPLLRLTLIKCSNDRFRFQWSFHHLIMDGWCLDIVNTELWTIYAARLRRQSDGLPPALDYREFASWFTQIDQLQAKNYWTTYLQGYEGETRIPFVPGKENVQKEFLSVGKKISGKVEMKIRQVAAAHHLAINNLLQAAWGLLLRAYNTDDVLYGVIVAGRPAEVRDIERMIGVFVNTLPRRITFSRTGTIIDIATDLQEQSIKAMDFQHYGLAQILKEMNHRGEIFDHILNYVNYPMADRLQLFEVQEGGASTISDIETFEQTHYDFSINILDKDGITIRFDYNRNVHDPKLMELMLSGFVNIVRQIADGETDINKIDALSTEHRELLSDFTDTKKVFDKSKMIHQLFEDQVRKRPDHIAVCCEEKSLTYRALNEKSNAIAKLLIDNGAGKNITIPVIMTFDLEYVLAFIGVLKAGATIVPLDASFPKKRLKELLGRFEIPLILGNAAVAPVVKAIGYPYAIISVDEVEHIEENPVSTTALSDAIYVMHTSGSTGAPKGVEVSHGGILNRLLWMNDYFGIETSKRVLCATRPIFDSSVWEIWWPLINGHTTVLPIPEKLIDGAYFKYLAERYQLTTADFVPALFREISESVLQESDSSFLATLKHIILGGEAIDVKVCNSFKKHFPEIQITNLYGPTEASIGCVCYKVVGSDNFEIPIGKPISNSEVLILDGKNNLVPIGAAGEICISGDCLATGYWRDQERTASVFLDHPLKSGKKIYKTGDVGKWLSDGNIKFLGRTDHQIKIRGYRIEPGEIETCLCHHQTIKQATVALVADESGKKFLCAYYVSDGIIPPTELKLFLTDYLPSYMIPSYFVRLSSFPLTESGKVDRKVLPLLDRNLPREAEFEPPINAVEKILAEVWQAVLGIDSVGVNDNFFDLGGTSIDLIVVSGKLKKHFDRDDLLIKMFRHSTIRALAKYIISSTEEEVHTVDEQSIDIKRERRRQRRSLLE